jgi:GTPase SAR1 family protein
MTVAESSSFRRDVRCGTLPFAFLAGRWQLLDRPVDYGAICSALSGRDGCGVVVVGAAGVGKTTLARTVTKSLRSQVHWTACTKSSQSISLGIFAPWLRPSGSRDPVALIASARESILTDEDPSSQYQFRTLDVAGLDNRA